MTTAVLRSAQAGAVLTSLSVGGARHVTMPLASATQVALARLTRILLLVAVALCLGAPTAGAVPAKKLDSNLAALWTTILQTPSAQNSFGSGGAAFACWDLGGTVAPFALTASSRARSSPAPRYSSRRPQLSAARSREMARLTPHYGRVPSKGTCNRRPASPSTTSPCR